MTKSTVENASANAVSVSSINREPSQPQRITSGEWDLCCRLSKEHKNFKRKKKRSKKAGNVMPHLLQNVCINLKQEWRAVAPEMPSAVKMKKKRKSRVPFFAQYIGKVKTLPRSRAVDSTLKSNY